METLGLTEAALGAVEFPEVSSTFDLQPRFGSGLKGLLPWRSPRGSLILLGTVISLMSPVWLPIATGKTQQAIAATATCPAVLRLNDTGPEVRKLQTLLTQKGYPVTVDGIFGEQTEIKLKLFQSKNGLDPDGIYGLQTCTALNQAAAATQPTTQQKPTSRGTTTNNTGNTGTNAPLRLNSEGDRVFKLQDNLRTLGYRDVILTGKFDQTTENAVRHFQWTQNLPVDGVVSTETQKRISGVIAGLQMYNPPTTQPTPVQPPTQYPYQATQTFTASQARYVVAVPSRSTTTLLEVQRFFPKAQLNSSRRGNYVQAGSYSSRETAESVSYDLRSHGFDARVFVD